MVKYPTIEVRRRIAQERGIPYPPIDWLTIPEDMRTNNISGKLTDQGKSKTNPTQTQAKFTNRKEGKHRTVRHKRASSNPFPTARAENCSTCGTIPAPVLFERTQYCGGKCVPFNDGSEAKTK